MTDTETPAGPFSADQIAAFLEFLEDQRPDIEDADRLGYEWAVKTFGAAGAREGLSHWPNSRKYLDVWTPMNWMSGYAYAQEYGDDMDGCYLWVRGVNRFVSECQEVGMQRDRDKRA